MNQQIFIRNSRSEEFEAIGLLMVKVYSSLEGFPNPTEQPAYYKMLANIGDMAGKQHTELIVALTPDERIVGAVVFFSDMANYGSGGSATRIKQASGFRLLAVDPNERGKGIGRRLCEECIARAKAANSKQLIIHSTESMKIAWGLYERLGFIRFQEIDFIQEELSVFGFQLIL